jgi:hypothetical protein
MGPHPPVTHHRRAPNLPKRHTQTGLDAKGVTSEQLRLQSYCSRTRIFCYYCFPFFKDFPARFAVWSPTISLIFLFLSSLFLLSFCPFSFLSFSLGFVSINIVTQLILNYTQSRDRNRNMGRKKGMETILLPKNKIVQDLEWNEKNGYPDPDSN